jgi:hypothetical protein
MKTSFFHAVLILALIVFCIMPCSAVILDAIGVLP